MRIRIGGFVMISFLIIGSILYYNNFDKKIDNAEFVGTQEKSNALIVEKCSNDYSIQTGVIKIINIEDFYNDMSSFSKKFVANLNGENYELFLNKFNDSSGEFNGEFKIFNNLVNGGFNNQGRPMLLCKKFIEFISGEFTRSDGYKESFRLK